MEKRQHKGKEGQEEDKKCPIHDAHIPGKDHLNATVMRLPARKEKKNLCNLSQKEGRSLFAVPVKRQKMTLPMSLRPHAGKLLFISGQCGCIV